MNTQYKMAKYYTKNQLKKMIKLNSKVGNDHEGVVKSKVRKETPVVFWSSSAGCSLSIKFNAANSVLRYFRKSS